MKAWLQGFDYEIYSDLVNAKIVALLKEEINTEAELFGKYEEDKAIITVNIKIGFNEKKRKIMCNSLLGKPKEINLKFH